MSLTGSLNSALSGLNAAARAAELISSNVANAMTEGYARRELQTSARVVGQSGQGVKVDGVLRQQRQLDGGRFHDPLGDGAWQCWVRRFARLAGSRVLNKPARGRIASGCRHAPDRSIAICYRFDATNL